MKTFSLFRKQIGVLAASAQTFSLGDIPSQDADSLYFKRKTEGLLGQKLQPIVKQVFGTLK